MISPVPDKKIIHRMGYYSNQEGIVMRYIREDENWNEHLAQTKGFIVHVVRKFRPALVTVLGSGWLLDIPLGEIINLGARVRLVDLIHPPGITGPLASEKAVEFVTDDITGGLLDIVWQMGQTRPGIDELFNIIAAPEYDPACEPGLVLSVNILSQLASLPFEFLFKKRLLKQSSESDFFSIIQQKHIDFLKKHNSVLITDVAEHHTDRSGRQVTRQVVHCRLPEGREKREWTWDFDTGGSYRQGHSTTMQVVAIHL